MTPTSTLTILAVAGITLTVTAAGVPPGKAEEAGMSSVRLAGVRESVQRHLDAGALPGAVTVGALQRDFENALFQAIVK